MSNIVRIPAGTAGTVPAAGTDYQAQNNLLFVFGLWGMGAYPLDLANNKVVKGAIFNLGGVLYKASADETITGTPSNYVRLTPISAGAQCSASYVANLSGVSWSDTYNGYVDVGGNLYLFDELLAMKNGAVTVPKTFIGRIHQSFPHGSQTITTGSGNFTVPAGVYSIAVTLIGGGGGGAGVRNTSGVSAGGGGGSGGVQRSTLSVIPGQNIAYSVGSGGAGATAPGSPGFSTGGNGTDTTFAGATTAIHGTGGNSLRGSDGASNFPGSCQVDAGIASTGVAANGNNATNPGRGGGSAISVGGVPANGGNGAAGLIIVEW